MVQGSPSRGPTSHVAYARRQGLRRYYFHLYFVVITILKMSYMPIHLYFGNSIITAIEDLTQAYPPYRKLL